MVGWLFVCSGKWKLQSSQRIDLLLITYLLIIPLLLICVSAPWDARVNWGKKILLHQHETPSAAANGTARDSLCPEMCSSVWCVTGVEAVRQYSGSVWGWWLGRGFQLVWHQCEPLNVPCAAHTSLLNARMGCQPWQAAPGPLKLNHMECECN